MFVKPNAIIRDNRAQDEIDDALAESTSKNLFHIQKQLVAAGTSLEAVLVASAKAHFGIRIHPHAPTDKELAA